MLDTYTTSDLIDLERAAGNPFGPFYQAYMRERAPEKVQKLLRRAAVRPDLVGSKQGFMSNDAADMTPASFTGVANSTTKLQLWTLPTIWTPLQQGDMRSGKMYKCSYGGTFTTTATPTYAFDPMIGTSATAGSNISLGTGPTITAGTAPASSPWYGEFTFGFRTIGLAASGATVTGNGFNVIPGAAGAIHQVSAMGGAVPANIDSTVANAFQIFVTWGTASALNAIVPTWVALQSLN